MDQVLATKGAALDPIISALIGLFLLAGSWRVLRSSLHILLEGTPEGMVLGDVAAAIGDVPGVLDVHDLHLWSVCSGYPALSAHVVVADASPIGATGQMGALKLALAERFGIHHTTIQIETANCGQGTVACRRE